MIKVPHWKENPAVVPKRLLSVSSTYTGASLDEFVSNDTYCGPPENKVKFSF
jgi:hypothetical protein